MAERVDVLITQYVVSAGQTTVTVNRVEPARNNGCDWSVGFYGAADCGRLYRDEDFQQALKDAADYASRIEDARLQVEEASEAMRRVHSDFIEDAA